MSFVCTLRRVHPCDNSPNTNINANTLAIKHKNIDCRLLLDRADDFGFPKLDRRSLADRSLSCI